jgi:integrase
MRVRLRGIKSTKKRLADGTVKIFHYLRETGAPISGEPGTPAFMASYNAAVAATREPTSGRFVELIAAFRASSDFTGLAPKTQCDYRRYIRAIESDFGDLPIAALSDPRIRAEFMEWRDVLAKTPRAADYAWTVLARILSWAKNRNLVAVNPCEKGGRIYAGGQRADIVWKPDDIRAFCEHASPAVFAVVMLALWTGQRQGDLLRLAWSAYDGKFIRLRQAKTGKRVSIPVGQTLGQFLNSIEKKAVTMLVNSKSRPWTSDGFRSSFFAACDAAGIRGLHFHDLRGTAVTRLALSGCSVAEIAAITGHSLKDVSALLEAHYLGGRLELAEQAALKLEERWGENKTASKLATK